MNEDQVKNIISDHLDEYATDNQYGVSKVPIHTHNRVDSGAVSFLNLENRTRYILYRIVSPSQPVVIGSSIGGDFVMPLSGYLTQAGATVDTAGTTGTMTINIKKNGTTVFKVKITIDSGSKTSRTATTKYIFSIDGSINFVVGDIFTFDVNGIQTTPAMGLTIFMQVIETLT